MAGETTITVVGNLTAPAEIRFTPSGAGVANFTVASTPRRMNRQSGDWEDGDPLFLRCSVWREQAENVAESLCDKGMRVIVQGRLRQRSYEKDGQTRTVYELEVDEVGPALRYAQAKVTKTPKGGGASSRGDQAPPADPWATGGGPGRGGSGFTEEPPFHHPPVYGMPL